MLLWVCLASHLYHIGALKNSTPAGQMVKELLVGTMHS